MRDKIQEIIAAYKADFNRVNEQERYKWEAIGHYKAHWKIDAEDFAGMLAEAFRLTDNLLAASMYYPYRMLKEYSKAEPETVRALFRMLYDESIPLAQRYVDFRAGFDKFVKPLNLNHYQDLHAISVYLAFQYPEKYYIYKYTIYKMFRDKIGFTEEKGKNKSEVWKLENYNRMCDLVLDVVSGDEEVLTMSKNRLDDRCYQDTAYHLLTTDVVYFGRWFAEEETESIYWPSLAEYNPNLSAADWAEILKDKNLTSEEALAMLKMILEQGGESTCSMLAEFYGNTPIYYSRLGSNYGAKIKKKYNCPDCMDGDVNRYYVIPFIGRNVSENGNKRYSWKLREELREALNNMDLSSITTVKEETKTDVSKNTILYGPPGTGKTYNTIIYAVAIIENKELVTVKQENYDEVLERYNEYKEEGLIEFTTFHQSYGYEEFIEGIKPEVSSGGKSGDVRYSIQPGVFKKFCEFAQDKGVDFEIAWKDLAKAAQENNGKYEFRRRTGSIIQAEYRKEDDAFVVTWSGNTNNKLKKEKVLEQWKNTKYSDREDIPSGGTKWMFDAIQAVIDELIQVFRLKKQPKDSERVIRNHVFVIDEINRGNISKIFGELITLIEPTKRVGQTEGMMVKLPYSHQLFGVPDNVYLIGTMNTADRSISTIDTALRRRFRFKEMMPDASVLDGISVEDISIKDMLIRMNQRIAALYDREHTIGHAYFIPLRNAPTIEVLATIFSDSIIPLLQEYFYEDYEKIRLVLGDNNKSNQEEQFILSVPSDYGMLFGNTEYSFDETYIYEINYAAFDNIEAYRSI